MSEYETIIKLVGSVNLRESVEMEKFIKWKEEDGSLKGLLKEFPYLKEVENE